MKEMVLSKFTRTVWDSYYKEIENQLDDCTSVLDLACGNSSPLKYIKSDIYKVGVDIYKPYLEESRIEGIHNDYIHSDIKDTLLKVDKNSFDAVVALDLIEHLTKKDGLRLISIMQYVAKKKLIIYTPNGFLRQEEYDDNPWQRHISGWNVDDMEKLGFKVIGMGGLRFLRGERGLIRFKPSRLWNILSTFSQGLVENRPKNAFSILCIKNV